MFEKISSISCLGGEILDPDRVQVLSLAQPPLEPVNGEIHRLIQERLIPGEIVTFLPVVEDGKDAGAEVAKDVFEDIGVGFDEVGAILLFVAPCSGEKILEI